jgi:hypothetical protein
MPPSQPTQFQAATAPNLFPNPDICSPTHIQKMRISRDPKNHRFPNFLTSTFYSSSQIHLISKLHIPPLSDSSGLPKTQESLRVTSVKMRRATNYFAKELFITCETPPPPVIGASSRVMAKLLSHGLNSQMVCCKNISHLNASTF